MENNGFMRTPTGIETIDRGEIGYAVFKYGGQVTVLTTPSEMDIAHTLSQFDGVPIGRVMEFVEGRSPSMYGFVFDLDVIRKTHEEEHAGYPFETKSCR